MGLPRPPGLADAAGLQAVFRPGADGRERLYLLHQPPPGRPVRGVLLHAHAWAEEMNKSRRMVALTSRALANQGWAVLQLDLLGCGDSAGDWQDATLDRWVDDLQTALQWLRERHPGLPAWLWGQRLGGLLATPLLQRLADAGLPLPHLLLWNPVLQGKQVAQQFLRLKAAAQLADGGGKAVLDEARAELAAGRSIEVAGYTLSTAMWASLQSANFTPPAWPAGARAPDTAPRLVWLELGAQPEPGLSPAAQRSLAAWQAAGWHTVSTAVPGPAFWQTVEIEDAPALTEATLQALAAERAEVAAPAHPPSPTASTAATGLLQPLVFGCEGQHLLGMLHPAAATLGVLVVVGGPQYRAGSHRQFVELARAAQAGGWPVMRFDVRGMGDSSGAPRSFEDLGPDVGAALDAFQRAQPQVRQVVLWGLCDGASAALLYLARRPDPRVAGLCLLNPWVRSAASLARTQVKHYYLQRLVNPDFWRKLLRGQVAWSALPEFLGKLGSARASKTTSSAASTPAARPQSYQERMLAGWQQHVGASLLVLSGDDYTAREFVEYTADQPAWQAVLRRPNVQRLTLDEADHTLSRAADRQALNAALLAWLQTLDTPAGPIHAWPNATSKATAALDH